MSVQSSVSSISYVGNNSTVTAYVIPFRALANSEIRVDVKVTATGVVTSLVLTTDFVISGDVDAITGTFVTVVAVPATSTVTVYRVVSETQLTVYTENAEFPASSHEEALDKLTFLAQQNARNVGQSVRVRVADGVLAEAAAVSSSLFGLSAGGAPVFQTAEQVIAFLSLTTPITNYPTKVWADNAARALAVPGFTGQVGVQVDTLALYTASGTSAGNWAAVTTTLPDGYLSADAAGRLKMADGYITALKIATGAFTADAAGRLPFAAGFVTATLLAATLDLSSKTLTMPTNHWRDIAPSGAVIQAQRSSYTTSTVLSANIPFDDTTPLVSEGTQILSVSITPSNASNIIRARFVGMAGTNGNTVFAMFKDSTFVNGVAGRTTGTDQCQSHVIESSVASGGTSAIVYTVRASDHRVNGGDTARKFGGAQSATLVVQEVKA